LTAAALTSFFAAAAPAVVFYARDEALHLAFPDAERVETRDYFLTADQRADIERRSKSKVESDLVSVYVGRQGESITGYAFIDTHMVRTLPETFMVVLDAKGRVSATHVLAFHEPTEYMPTERWLKQFDRRNDPGEIRVGQAIASMTGSTLSAHAVAGAVRRALAMHEVLLRGN
jgi:transcriptional regulator of nitric oxide reductase